MSMHIDFSHDFLNFIGVTIIIIIIISIIKG